MTRTREICLGLIALLCVQNTHTWMNEDKTMPVCKTSDCQKLSDMLKKDMQGGGNPCNDFYDHVCHSWGKNNPRPKYKYTWNVHQAMQEKTNQELKKLLEGKPTKEKYIEEARNLYKACKHIPYLEKSDANSVKKVVQKIENWQLVYPVKNGPSKLPWQIDNEYLKLTGESAFFELTILADDAVPDAYVTQLNRMASPYGMIKRNAPWGNGTQELQHYKNYLHKVIEKLAPSKFAVSKKDIDDELHKVIMFRDELRLISVATLQETYNRLTIQSLQQWYDKQRKNAEVAQIGFLDDVSAIYKSSKVPKITDGSKVDVLRLYFVGLANLMAKTDRKVLESHVHLYFAERHLKLDPQLEEELKHSVLDTPRVSGRIRYEPDRLEKCLASNNLKFPLGQLYIMSAFTQDEKSDVSDLLDTAKKLLVEQILNSNWLDAKTKNESLLKMNKLKSTIGYPAWYNPNVVVPYPREHDVTPIQVDAFNMANANRLSFSAAYLQSPMYMRHVPYVVDYGSTVMTIGHELYHSFDTKGITYNSVGSRPWWSDNMLKQHAEQTKCLRQQYSVYRNAELVKRHIHPTKPLSDTIDEDLADTMGLKLAYKGYRQKLQESHGICGILPGFEKVGCEKLFFILFGHSFCSDSSVDMDNNGLQTDLHSFPRIRVNGAVANMREFSDAFGCKAGDPMRAEKTCDLWHK